MKKFIAILCTIAFLAGGMATQAGAALQAVGPVNPATGYPIWYEDANGLRIELCLDQNGMCLAVLPNPALPPSVPGNWDPAGEAFYWLAEATLADPGVDALLVLAMESSFVGAITPGGQAAFTRIRIRMTPTQTGTFVVSHPYGTVTLDGVAGVVQTVTQDIPGLVAGAFAAALLDDPVQAGTVNATGAGIGPFLRPTTAPVIVGGNTYLANPGAPVTVTGAVAPNLNAFTITGPGIVNATTDLFTVQAKVSGCAAVGMTPPVAVADPGAAAAAGKAKVINVAANYTPGTAPGAAPGDPAVPVAINPASVAVTAPVGGTAVKNADGIVTYTPNPDFTGTGGFSYTVQDNCGQVTAPMAVPVIVEQLAATKAEFRAKTGKWTITGTTSNADAANVITLRKGDGVTGPVIGTTNVQADKTFKFVGKSKTGPGSPAQPQNINVESSAAVNVTAPLKMR